MAELTEDMIHRLITHEDMWFIQQLMEEEHARMYARMNEDEPEPEEDVMELIPNDDHDIHVKYTNNQKIGLKPMYHISYPIPWIPPKVIVIIQDAFN